MARALLLNSDFTPLHFVSDFAAVVLFYKGTAEVVTGMNGGLSLWDDVFRSPSTSIQVPATLRLLKRCNKRWPPPRFRKKVVFNRDEWRCQYCAKKLHNSTVTVDHVVPTSRGGQTSWLNCVTACKACNDAKANRTPGEAKMKLAKRPTVPSRLHFWDANGSAQQWHDDWSLFLPTG